MSVTSITRLEDRATRLHRHTHTHTPTEKWRRTNTVPAKRRRNIHELWFYIKTNDVVQLRAPTRPNTVFVTSVRAVPDLGCPSQHALRVRAAEFGFPEARVRVPTIVGLV